MKEKQDLINYVLTNKLIGRRPRVRPRQKWMDRAKNDLLRIDEAATIEDLEDRQKLLDRLSRSWKTSQDV